MTLFKVARPGPSSPRPLTTYAVWIVAVATGITALLHPESALSAPLRVMTYNIHHAEGTDNVIDINRIASIINSANPDLVALQEVYQATDTGGTEYFQLDDLAALTGMQGYFGAALTIPPAFGTGEYGNAVLVSPDISIGNTTNHPLPNPAAGEPRAVIEMELSLDDTGSAVEFTLFATHFDNASETNRIAQAEFVNDLVTASTAPALLAGDLNATPGSAPMQIVDDEWIRTSNHLSGIDYVLYRAVDQWSVVQPGQFILNPTTTVASDHYPLLAEVEIVPEPRSFILIALGTMLLVLAKARTRVGPPLGWNDQP